MGASEPCRVSLDEPAIAGGLVAGVLGGDDRGGLPARPAAGAGWLDWRVPGGVEHDPGDVDEGVGAVGVDGDPLAGPGLPVALELGRVLGVVAEHAGAVEHEAGRARAVVAGGELGEWLAVPAALDVGLVDELVAGGDRELHRPRRVLRRGREPARQDLRGLAGRERQRPPDRRAPCDPTARRRVAGWVAAAVGVISPRRLPVPGFGAGVTVTCRTPQASWAARPCQS